MRIHIVLDVEPHEVDHAQSLIESIHRLTQDVVVNVLPIHGGGDTSSPPSGGSGDAPVHPTKGHDMHTHHEEDGAGAAGAGDHASPTPRGRGAGSGRDSHGVPTTATQPLVHSSGSASTHSASSVSSVLSPTLPADHPLAPVQAFYRETLVKVAQDGANASELVHHINMDFADNGVTAAKSDEPTARFDLFFRELCACMFEHGVAGPLPGVRPYIAALAFLTRELQETTRARLTKWVLQYLAKPRSVKANRRDLFLPAEALALLISLQYVNAEGAVKTIITLLRAPATRCAGWTLLGKTVEIAIGQLQAPELKPSIQALIELCDANGDPAHEYDVNYCRRNLSPLLEAGAGALPVPSPHGLPPTAHGTHFGKGAGSGAHEGAREPALVLEPIGKLEGIKSPVFAMKYDAKYDELVTGGKAGDITVWDAAGGAKQVLRFPVKDNFITALDIDESRGDLFVCGTSWGSGVGGPVRAREGDRQGTVAHFTRTKGSGGGVPLWRLVGSRQDPVDCMLALSCASLPSAGATRHICVASSHQQHHAVTLYDVGVTPLAFAKPLWVGSEHTNIITSVAAKANTFIVASGSHDSTVRIWDVRTSGSVATLGERNGGHSKGISCVDLAGNVAGSASSDGTVALWDLRSLQVVSKVTVGDGSKAMQIALGPTQSTAAVTGTSNVYMVDFVAGTSTPPDVSSGSESSQYTDRRYHVLTWNNVRDTLFAGGSHLDIFKPVRTAE